MRAEVFAVLSLVLVSHCLPTENPKIKPHSDPLKLSLVMVKMVLSTMKTISVIGINTGMYVDHTIYNINLFNIALMHIETHTHTHL
jgi:hypothetical protein